MERVRSSSVGGLGMLSMLQCKSKEYRGQLLSGARTAKQCGKSYCGRWTASAAAQRVPAALRGSELPAGTGSA